MAPSDEFVNLGIKAIQTIQDTSKIMVNIDTGNILLRHFFSGPINKDLKAFYFFRMCFPAPDQ